MHVVNSLHFFVCVDFFDQNLIGKAQTYLLGHQNFRHYHSACSTVAIMAHVPLLIATMYRDVFDHGSS